MRIQDMTGQSTYGNLLCHRRARVLLALIISITCNSAFCQQLSSTMISPTQIRDGGIAKLTCRLDVIETSTLGLACYLVNGRNVRLRGNDCITTATYPPGAFPITRALRINLPPASGEDDEGEYSAVWELRRNGNVIHTEIKADALTILPAIVVRIPILMYHRILPAAAPDAVSVTDFLSQMRMLKAYGYTSVTFDDLMAYRAGIVHPPAKPVILTADDGYQSWLKYAEPILSDPAIDFCMTGFLQTDAIDKATSVSASEDPYMTWDQAVQLESRKTFDLQPHTISHPHLPEVSDAQAWQELSVSKNAVETHLGKEARFIAFPYGDYSPRDQQLAWQAGYCLALTDSGGVEKDCRDKWDLDRVGVYDGFTMEYERSRAWAFFPTIIGDPDVVIPNIAIESIDFQNAATSISLKGNAETCTTVTVVVSARNKGVAAYVKPLLRIYRDGRHQCNCRCNNKILSQNYYSRIIPISMGFADYEVGMPRPKRCGPGRIHGGNRVR